MKNDDTDRAKRPCRRVCWRTCLIGSSLALFGLSATIGWLGHETRLIRLAPGFVAVPYATALGFFLSGLALVAAGIRSRTSPGAASSAERGSLVRFLTNLLPALVVLLGVLALVEWQTGIDLGLTPDPRAVRHWFVEANPGQMSPLDAIGFIAIGLAIRLGSGSRSPRAAVIAHGLTLLAIFVGFVGVIGDIAGLGGLLARYIGPVFLAGLGFLAAGFAVLALLRHRSRTSWSGEDADKIGLIAGAIMLITASSGILGGFAALYPQAVGELESNLVLSLKSRSDALQMAIQQAWQDSNSFANQPLRVEAMRVVDATDVRRSLAIQAVAQQYEAFGFSGVIFRDAVGHEVARAGSFVAAPELAVPITTPTPSTLLWDGGYVLHARANMVSKGIVVGTLEAERRLTVGRGLQDATRFGSTLDFPVCAPAGPDAMSCFPFHSTGGKVLRNLPRYLDGEPIPAAYALAGQTGIVHTRDYRGAAVIAAHQPIGALGLGAVLKIDAEQLYSPIAQRLKLLLAGALIVGAAGTFLLRLQVLPLVRTLACEISERRKAEEELQESEERFRLISTVAPEAILTMGLNGEISYWNPAAARMFGYSENEVVGKNLHELLAPSRFLADFRRGHEQFLANGTGPIVGKSVETTALHQNGQAFPVELSVSALRIKDQWHALGVIRDISERKRTEEQIRHLSYYDFLTDLPNRRLFMDRLSQGLIQARRNKRSLAVLYLDLDRFKVINDTLGHDVGDALLVAVAGRLRECVRSSDTVSRLGGDEFAVVLVEIAQPEDAAVVAEKVIESLKEPVHLGDHDVKASTSIGIAIYPVDGTDDAQALIKKADIALYKAKAEGRNQYAFSREVDYDSAPL